MTKHYRQRLITVIALSFLSFTSPLLLTRNAVAENRSASKANPKEFASVIEKLKTNDERELDAAIEKLGKIGEPAIPALMKALQDTNLQVRRSAAEVLRQIGPPAIPALTKAFKDSDANVRSGAASALGSMGAEAKTVLPQLVPLLKDSDAYVRRNAADALGSMGAEAKTALPQLVPLFKDSDANVRGNAAFAVGRMGAEAKTALPQLLPLLKDSDAGVRIYAADAVGSIGAEAKTALPQLVPLLKDSDAKVRSIAASALGRIGAEAKTGVPQLLPLLKDSDAGVRSYAAYALVSMGLSLQEKAKTLTSPELDRAVSNLESALKTLAEAKADYSQPTSANLRVYIKVLKDEQTARLFVKSIIQNPYIWGTGIYLFLLFGTFAIRPLWLLKTYETLKPVGFKLPVFGTNVSLDSLIFFKYHPRVLDAWVAAHIQATRDEFQKRETVRDRQVLVPVPVILDNNTIATLKGKDLQPTFAQKRGCLLIWEEGGAGKTSLACLIGKWAMSDNPEERICHHRMLPVLIESELNMKVAEGKQPFLEAIRGQLQDLTDTAEPISEELLEQLLKQRRILVIVDHFSEMSEQTQTAIRPEMPDFPVNALLVTSRLEEPLGLVTKTAIKPLRIAGNRLSSFMESYLTQRQKRDLFSDTEFFDACIQLSTIAGDRNITILLAKLYGDQIIAKKKGTTDGNLPENIAELMLHYLNQVNHSVPGDKFSDSSVHKDAKIIAWECLKQTYRPAAANRQNAIDALGEKNAESRLNYLEYQLRIMQTKGVAHDKIYFALDPVAEYLAALQLLDINGKDESKWQDFLKVADSQKSPEAIKGFMLAVKDCYLDKIPGAKDTDFLPKEITSRYNITIAVPPQSPQAVLPG
jgi:HEAT repeat protein